jgi:hypothetical protein
LWTTHSVTTPGVSLRGERWAKVGQLPRRGSRTVIDEGDEPSLVPVSDGPRPPCQAAAGQPSQASEEFVRARGQAHRRIAHRVR